MTDNNESIIEEAYIAFNERDIEAVLHLMSSDVRWPNGWEGGYVEGHNEVKSYWTRQWKEIDPKVVPVSIKQREDGKVEVTVQQTIKDLEGRLLTEGVVKHVYVINEGLIKSMEIEK